MEGFRDFLQQSLARRHRLAIMNADQIRYEAGDNRG